MDRGSVMVKWCKMVDNDGGRSNIPRYIRNAWHKARRPAYPLAPCDPKSRLVPKFSGLVPESPRPCAMVFTILVLEFLGLAGALLVGSRGLRGVFCYLGSLAPKSSWLCAREAIIRAIDLAGYPLVKYASVVYYYWLCGNLWNSGS